jgi:F-type H+-transporting ATPase subunit epsilon
MNTTNTFHFRLVSPEAEIVNAPATFASVPGTEGDMGIYAGHMPVISGLRVGSVTVTLAGADTATTYEIENGFVDINATTCTVIAEKVRVSPQV